MKKNLKSQVSSLRFSKITFGVYLLLVFQLSIINYQLSFSQQLPYYTQYKPNNIMLNPGVVGTKRIADVRMNYRAQWVGFEGAPVTMGISGNSRIVGGTMGVGAAFFTDKTGPTKRNDFSFAYSYHAHFEDVELSVGAAGHHLSYIVDGTELHMHVPYDNTIDLASTQTKKVWDMSAGALFYNDRFHLGISMLNLAEPSINYYPDADTVHKTNIHMVPHAYGSVGYNWSGQPEWVWENSLQVAYAAANPMTIDYNLRIHYKQKIFGGFSIRMRDAIALHAGFTFMDDFNISYSYDVVTSQLRSYQGGSHEIMIVWSSNLGMDTKKKYDNNRFKKQRYGYMF